jgi:hypothetical protein
MIKGKNLNIEPNGIGCICGFFYIFLIYTLNKKLSYTPCYVLEKKIRLL